MRNKIILILGLVASAFLLNSCLKDTKGEDWTAALKGKMYAEIEFPGFWAYTITPIATDQYYNFVVNIATDQPPTTDITVTLDVDAAAMDAYNKKLYTADTTALHAADTSKNHVLLGKPDTTFVPFRVYPGLSFNKSATIKAGSRNTRVTLILSRADTVNLSNKYMAPISLKTVSAGVTIAANKTTILVGLPVANQWEGDYLSTGRLHKETAWDRSWADVTKHLSTMDATSVTFPAFDIGAGAQVVFDPVTFEVTAINDLGALGFPYILNTVAINKDGQGGDSHWDPSTNTLYLYYYYVGSGGLMRCGHEVLVKQ